MFFLRIWLGCLVLFTLTTTPNYFSNKDIYYGQLYLIKGTEPGRVYGTRTNHFSINPRMKICTDKYHSNTFFRRSFYHLKSYYEEEGIIEATCIHNRWKRSLEKMFFRDSKKRHFRDIFWWTPKELNSTIFLDNNTFVGYSCYPELNSCSLNSGMADLI